MLVSALTSVLLPFGTPLKCVCVRAFAGDLTSICAAAGLSCLDLETSPNPKTSQALQMLKLLKLSRY